MLAPTLELIKKYTDKPIAVGFGVSTPDQAKEVAKIAEGVIIGSAIVNVIEKYKDDSDVLLASVGEFASNLAEAIKNSM
jgi:tryptophan synthase alpha chain